MSMCPVTPSNILAALVAGKFKPLTAHDCIAFFDAGDDDAVTRLATPNIMVLACPIEGGAVAFEVYDFGLDARVWQGALEPL